MRDPEVIRGTLKYLRRRQIEIQITPTLQEAIEVLSQRRIKVLLLSINIFHPRIEMVPEFLKREYGIDCVLFSELEDRKSHQKLNSVRARHTIFGPPGGHVVFLKLRQIAQEQAPDLFEENKPNRNRSRRLSLFDASKDQRSVYVGSQRDPLATSNKESTSDEQLSDKLDIFNWDDNEPETEPEEQLAISPFLLQNCAREALRNICDTSFLPLGPNQGELKSAALIGLKVGDQQGCLLVGTSRESTLSKPILDAVLKEFLAALKDHGIELSPDEYTFTQLTQVERIKSAFANTEFVLSGYRDETDISVAVVEGIKAIPEDSLLNSEMVVFEATTLLPDIRVDFDIYIYLPVNRKYLHYVKSGGSLSEKQVQKLQIHQIKHVHIKREAREAFLEFVANQSPLLVKAQGRPNDISSLDLDFVSR